MREFLALAMALFLALPAAAFPQDAPARIKSRSELVVVPVTVKDRDGALVSDLRREEFRVLEDGVEQDITLFSVDPFPLSAVVLLDNDLPVNMAESVQRSLESIAAGFSASDEAALVLFDQFPQTALDFTSDNDKFFKELQRTKLGSSLPGGGSQTITAPPQINGQPVERQAPPISKTFGTSTKRIDDAIHSAAEMLRARGRDRRKIIFLISDGRNSRNNQWSFDDTLQLLLSADISVYAIVAGPGLLKHGSHLLANYATTTGGDYFYASKQSQMERLYSRLTEQARNQYTLAFVPHAADSHRDYHSIEVRVRRPDLDLLARQGYYTPGPR